MQHIYKEQRLRKRALLGEGSCPMREPPLNPWVQTQYLWCRPTNLFCEEGPRYPRAQTIPQLKPTCAGSGSGPCVLLSAAPQTGNVRTPRGRSNGHGPRHPLQPRLLRKAHLAFRGSWPRAPPRARALQPGEKTGPRLYHPRTSHLLTYEFHRQI